MESKKVRVQRMSKKVFGLNPCPHGYSSTSFGAIKLVSTVNVRILIVVENFNISNVEGSSLYSPGPGLLVCRTVESP